MRRIYFLFLNALFFAPSFLFAEDIANSKLIFTWGYGDVMNEILQAVKGITTETGFIVQAAFGIAFLLFGIKKAMDAQSSPVMELGKMFVLFAVIWNFFLKAPNDASHRFMIHDEVTSKDYIVSQVPLAIGASFAFMSQFERVILKGMEKYYSTPQSTNFSQAGLGFSLEAMTSLPNIKLSAIAPTTQKNMDYFMRNCIIIGLELHKNSREIYTQSDNLVNDLFDVIGRGSQLTPYYTSENGVETQTILPCSEVGARMKNELELVMDDAQTLHAALLGFDEQKQLYEAKFQAVAQIFNSQATNARSYLQQSMLLLSQQDAIINTAKSVGLNPSAVAANTAVADQNFFASMQAQGRLAQTYLPLAKVYLTAVIIGASWLMAILSIIFSSTAYIRMFFTLLIWMVLWTPMLSIINYLNDYNLMKVADVITGGKQALTLSTNMLIFKKVADSSNFMNYLAMATPLLAFAIAKASEQGFVSFASGLSQALAGASRAAGSFANQQALSTQTSIAAPRGDEVIAYNAGVMSHQYARNIEGVVTKMNTQNTYDNQTYNSEISNANMHGTNINGMISGSSLSAGTLTTVNSVSEANSNAWNKNFNDQYSHMSQSGRSSALNEAKGFAEKGDETFKKAFANNIGEELQNRTDLTNEEKASIGLAASAQLGFNVFGSGVQIQTNADSKRSIGNTESFSEAQKAAYNEIMERASLKTLSTTKGMDSSWSNTLSGSDANTYSKIVGYAQSYTQTEQGVQAVNSNNLDNTLNVVARDLAAADNKDFGSLNTAQQNEYFTKAGNYVSDMIKNDPAQLAQYNSQYGAMNTINPNNTTMPQAGGMNFKTVNASEQSVLTHHNQNMDKTNQRELNTMNSTTMPNGQEIKHVATTSKVAQENKQEGDKIKETSRNWNPIGKETPPII